MNNEIATIQDGNTDGFSTTHFDILCRLYRKNPLNISVKIDGIDARVYFQVSRQLPFCVSVKDALMLADESHHCPSNLFALIVAFQAVDDGTNEDIKGIMGALREIHYQTTNHLRKECDRLKKARDYFAHSHEWYRKYRIVIVGLFMALMLGRVALKWWHGAMLDMTYYDGVAFWIFALASLGTTFWGMFRWPDKTIEKMKE